MRSLTRTPQSLWGGIDDAWQHRVFKRLICPFWSTFVFLYKNTSLSIRRHSSTRHYYKVLTTSQPTYLHNLISLQTESFHSFLRCNCHTRSSTHHLFSENHWSLFSACLASFLEPTSCFTSGTTFTFSCLSQPIFLFTISPFITSSLFHPKPKTYLFGKSFPP